MLTRADYAAAPARERLAETGFSAPDARPGLELPRARPRRGPWTRPAAEVAAHTLAAYANLPHGREPLQACHPIPQSASRGPRERRG